jgi:hypothetical protein
MYICKSLIKLLTWHKKGAGSNVLIRCVPNSLAWKHIINGKWSNFATNTHNIRLGLALDEFNPLGDLNSYHFTWPMVLLNYNLPPWLVIKKYVLILALIIPNKEPCTSTNVDDVFSP